MGRGAPLAQIWPSSKSEAGLSRGGGPQGRPSESNTSIGQPIYLAQDMACSEPHDWPEDKAGVGLWSQHRVIEAGAGGTQDDRPGAVYKGTTDSAVVWTPMGISLHHWGDTEWQMEPRFTYTLALWGLASS